MGVVYSMYNENFPPKAQWSTDQVPDLTGQVMMVTGGSSGIGKETAKVLLAKGAKVYLAARSKSKADEAIKWLEDETGGKSAVFLELDLADFRSIRSAVDTFKQTEQKLDVLFNNAGVMGPPIEDTTPAGYDLQFGTHVLGHYLLTALLLPVLLHTAQTSPRGHVRVINLSASAQWFAPDGGIDYSSLIPNDPNSEARRREMGSGKLYAQSKWGVIAFSNELSRRYGSRGIISISLHPGLIRSGLQRHINMGLFNRIILRLFLWPASQGALTPLYAGTAPEAKDMSRQYLIPWARLSESRADAYDEELGRRLWSWLEEQTNLK